MPCLLPPLALGNRGGDGASPATALGRRSGPGAALGEGKWERETRGADSPFDLGTGGPQGGNSRQRRLVGGGGHGGAAVGVDGGQGWGQEGEGIVGVRFPPYLGPRWSREVGTRR